MGLVTDLDLAGLTDGKVGGDGVFDVLMTVSKAHLKEEYIAGRLKGDSYATAYVGSVNAVLAQSVQFYSQSEIGKNQIKQILATVTQTEAQTALLGQKLTTEKAQTEGSIQKIGTEWSPLATDAEGYVGGTLGRQMVLHATQADGFLRDAEQKAANKLIDTWSVRRSTDSGVAATVEAHLRDEDIGVFIQKMATGVGLTLPS